MMLVWHTVRSYDVPTVFVWHHKIYHIIIWYSICPINKFYMGLFCKHLLKKGWGLPELDMDIFNLDLKNYLGNEVLVKP